MLRYEYKVVPAPRNGLKVKGVKSAEGRYALALETLMNDMGSNGWEYQRAETLPSEERSGFASRKVVVQHVLIFRRPSDAQAPAQPANPAAPSVLLPKDIPHRAPPVMAPAARRKDDPDV